MVRIECSYIERSVHTTRVLARARARCVLVVSIIFLLLPILFALFVSHFQHFTPIQFSAKCFQH